MDNPCNVSLSAKARAFILAGGRIDGQEKNEITIEANLLDRTLSAPEGMVSGLSRNHLLVVHLEREISKMGEAFSGGSGYSRSEETYTHAQEVLWET